MTLGFLSGSKNFCKLLCVSCEVLFLHGYAWIHWVAKSGTTIAYRWLFRDSKLSLRTLWSAAIKSPKFPARGTASLMRLLHGAIVILVLLQISQFRSLGKWVWTLCLPKSTLLVDVGSKNGSWEELACESLCSATLSSTRFSLNSCSHSRISEWHGSHRSWSWSSFWFGFGFLVGLVNIGSPRSFINRSWHGHWRDVTLSLIPSFSSLNFTYCRWRRRDGRRWWAMTLLSWRCPWSWWRSRRRTWQAWNHNRNEVLRVAWNPISFF